MERDYDPGFEDGISWLMHFRCRWGLEVLRCGSVRRVRAELGEEMRFGGSVIWWKDYGAGEGMGALEETESE